MTSREHDDAPLLRKRRGAVEWLIFHRPRVRNAMSPAMEEALLTAVDAIAADDTVKAVVFTGARGDKPAFMAGADMGALSGATDPVAAVALEREAERLIVAIEQLRIPTVAAMAGACVGQGALLTSACDVRIAAPSLRFGFPIARTVGNCLSLTNYARLIAMMGEATTKEMIFSARLLGADDLMAARSIRAVVGDDEIEERAQEVAEALTKLAPLTLWATRQALLRLRDHAVPANADDDLLAACYGSRDMQEAIAAFLAKREPNWLGR
ncbi:enoyl-CoA hydratase/isomerase family protein [Ancylobacter sonchi]|uniref:enoyl-CoA hydratase n=1 Tax=Ancylobacter sonchi TaxID=1937790 RepID=UPI001BD614BD|nr:enoyl-CoA hydratase [Ancylobacter sonchi]MBS7534769.1 enoyl-CoA hydratase/isomerase family protein [Ancylobacter sonchi]